MQPPFTVTTGGRLWCWQDCHLDKYRAYIQQVRINTILNMATQIGDEQTLKALCDVMDWDFDELKEQLKNADSHTAQDARTALGVILPDDPDNPDDEPVEE